jgi:integrative and conjugative element protein (TIGR02256 family)
VLEVATKPIYFCRPAGGVVKIDVEALRPMRDYAQLTDDALEGGGVLIGRHLIDSNDVVVDKVTVPMRGDRRSRTSFHRARKLHQQVLDREWARSDHTSVYLGEWHTHPERTPSPSGIDMDDWRRRLRHDSVEEPFLVFFIVGQRDIRGWEGSGSSFGISPLRLRRISKNMGVSI